MLHHYILIPDSSSLRSLGMTLIQSNYVAYYILIPDSSSLRSLGMTLIQSNYVASYMLIPDSSSLRSLGMTLNKVHYQQCGYRENINQCEEVVEAFPFFSEVTQFSGKYSYCRDKEDKQEGKEFDVKEDCAHSFFHQAGKINNQK